MKGRSTLFLLIAVLILGGFIWMQETWRSRTAARSYAQRRLFDLDASSLVSIRFRSTNTVVQCVRQGEQWLAGSPDGGMGLADVARVYRTVSMLSAMGKGTTISSEQLEVRGMDASEYGFDDPMVEIEAVDNQGRRRWLIGRKAPLGEMVYAMQEGDDNIYTVPSKVLEAIPDDPDALRDRVLFPGDAVGLRRIEIRGASGFIELLKDAKTGWHLQQPVPAEVDPPVLDEFIDDLFRIRVEDFLADNVSDWSIYGLQDEVRQISLGWADGSSRMLVVGDAVPDRPGLLYARRADDTTAFAVKDDVLRLLDIRDDQLRDAAVLTLPPESIDRLAMGRGALRVNLMQEDDGWATQTPVVWKADDAAVERWIEQWSNAVVIDYDVQTNNVPVEWELLFGSTALGQTNRLEVLATGEARDGLLIRRKGEDRLHRINLTQIPLAAVDPLMYKDRHVWSLDREAVSRIALNRTGVSPHVIERMDEGTFAPAGTNGTVQVNTEAVDQLLARLSRMRTTRYVTYNPRQLDIFGLENPSLELHISLSGTNELGRILMVGRETPDGYYGMVKGRDVIFLLDPSVIELLSSDLLMPEVAAPPATE